MQGVVDVKITIDISSDYQGKEIIIRSAEDDEELKSIVKSIKEIGSHFDQIHGYLDETVYALNLSEILFFETNERNVYAHTKDNAFLIHYRLYELEENLPDNFVRVSKSAILNVELVSTLTKSVTGNLIEFTDSYKTMYVSRRFLKNLQNSLQQRSFTNEK